jgi:uncharacterized protein (TIGR03083 family)
MTSTGTRPDKAFWLSSIRGQASALRDAAATDGALAAELPSCPGWTVSTLLAHTGSGFRWVANHVVRGSTDQPGSPDRSGAPDGDALLAWWDDSLALLLDALERVDPTLPAWNPAPTSKVALYWHRRYAHEIAVHRWDAQLAVGLPEPVEASLAVDGVDEALDTLLPAGFGHRRGGDGLIQIIASDSEQSWIVRVRGEAISLLDTATLIPEEHDLRTQVTGSASDLLLAVWGRVPFDNLDVTGDAALLEALRVG